MAYSPAFVAMGDLHLQRFIWAKHRYVVGDSYLAADAVINTAIDLYVPIVLLGDVFDTVDPGPEVVEFFRTRMERCKTENIPVYVIQGNHDRQKVPWPSAIHSWPVYIGDGKPVKIAGLDCVGLDFMYKAKIEAALLELAHRDSKPQILCMHQALKQALKFEGKWNCDLELVPPGIPLVLLGDIHKEMEFRFGGEQMALYTGASHLTDISERGPKSCTVVNHDLTYSRVPLPYREVEKVTCVGEADIDKLAVWAEKHAEGDPVLPPVAFVSYLDTLGEKISKIVSRYKDDIIFITSMSAVPEDLDVDFEDTATTAIVSVPTMLQKMVDKDADPLVYEMILTLLSQGEPVREVLSRFRSNFFEGKKDGA